MYPVHMTKLRAARYRRISDDREGLELGVARQDEDTMALCVRNGYQVVADLCDNDISASTLSSKARPQYDEMMRRGRAGEFDVIVAYTSGRITRRPRENEDLIELAERHGVRFAYVASPAFDLNTADGRHVARILAAGDAAEPERIGERVRRKLQQRRDGGLTYNGAARFGYAKIGPATYELVQPEADLLLEAYRKIVSGQASFEAIANAWNAMGVTTTKGGRWTRQTLRHMMCNGFGLGVIRENPKTKLGKRSAMGAFVERTNGVHPIITTEEEAGELWRAFKARHDLNKETREDQNAQARSTRTTHEHMLSGLILCPCERRMAVKYHSGRVIWVCPGWKEKKHSYIAIEDSRAQALVMEWLDGIAEDGENIQARIEEGEHHRRTATLVERNTKAIETLKRERDKVALKAFDDEITPEEGRVQRDGIDAEIRALTVAMASAELDHRAAMVPLPDFATLLDGWSDRTVQARHDALGALVVGFVVVRGDNPRRLVSTSTLDPLPRWTQKWPEAPTGEGASG